MSETCPVCGTVPESRVVRCPRCDTPHHAECWELSGGCAVFGCNDQNIELTRDPASLTALERKLRKTVDLSGMTWQLLRCAAISFTIGIDAFVLDFSAMALELPLLADMLSDFVCPLAMVCTFVFLFLFFFSAVIVSILQLDLQKSLHAKLVPAVIMNAAQRARVPLHGREQELNRLSRILATATGWLCLLTLVLGAGYFTALKVSFAYGVLFALATMTISAAAYFVADSQARLAKTALNRFRASVADRRLVRAEKREQPTDEPGCPLCGAPAVGLVVSCPRCGRTHHAGCWEHLHDCAVIGCNARGNRLPGEGRERDEIVGALDSSISCAGFAWSSLAVSAALFTSALLADLLFHLACIFKLPTLRFFASSVLYPAGVSGGLAALVAFLSAVLLSMYRQAALNRLLPVNAGERFFLDADIIDRLEFEGGFSMFRAITLYICFTAALAALLGLFGQSYFAAEGVSFFDALKVLLPGLLLPALALRLSYHQAVNLHILKARLDKALKSTA